MISDFHFLRPWWLAASLPVAWLAWELHRGSKFPPSWQGIVAAPLLPHLVREPSSNTGAGPSRLLLACWLLCIIGLAGPTWQREPSPFADDVAALAIVIKVTPSMMTEDVPPNRLSRSVQKISDLLARRGGAKAALIAYAGSVHVVIPPTSDPEIIRLFAGSLQPEIMPREGDAAAEALQTADRLLAEAGGGSLLWVADEMSPDQLVPIENWRRSSRTPVRILAPLPETESLDATAEIAHAKVIRLKPDDSDIAVLERAAHFSSPVTGDSGVRWQDSGYWLTPLLVLLLLPFFRKGWMPLHAARL